MAGTHHRGTARLTLVATLLVTGTLASPTPLGAAVVVLSNRSRQTVRCQVEPVWGQQKRYSLEPGKLIPVQVPDRVQVTFTSAKGEVRQRVEPNTVHYFVAGPEGLELEQDTFSRSLAGAWLHVDRQGGPPEAVVVPVKILVDDEQPALRRVWEPRLRGQLGVASKYIELYCGVRFEVVALETWESDPAHDDLPAIDADFRQKVTPQPAWLAIGFTSQYRVPAKDRSWHPIREPFCTHLLLPDVQRGFSGTEQLELLVHDLGHFLGAVHSPENDSIMRHSLGDRSTGARAAGTTFDAVNTLLMNLIAEEIRNRRARNLGEIPRSTREYLRAIYSEMARRFPDDRDAARYAELVREPVVRQLRYLGQWADGTRWTGEAVGPWHETTASPTLGSKPLFDEGCPIRWLLDTTQAPAERPKAMVEFVGGDRLPGRVVAVCSGSEAPHHRLPPHLLVVPHVRLDLPERTSRPHVRVATDWVRRIVWQPVAHRYRPQTLFLRDGRQLEFRSVRMEASGVRLLREEGISSIPLADVAELHFPSLDPWEAYFRQLAVLAPGGSARLIEVETAGGLRLTSSSERFQAQTVGRDEKAEYWYHLFQPAWSLDAFWVQHHAIRLRRYFLPHEVPLSRIEPARSRQQSDLGGVRHFRVDRNVEGGPLESGGRQFQWGLGVHALSELEFPLPPCARRFRTRLGLDQLAGQGGCVRASVSAGPATGEPLFQSELMIGSTDVLDTGDLPLDGRGAAPARLLLRVDPAHDRRPAGADPFDVRDVFDWLEPLLELDPQLLRAEARQRSGRTIPAWDDWEVVASGGKAPRLVNYWDQTDPKMPAYRLLAAAEGGPLTLSATVSVRPEKDRLLLAVCRPAEAGPSGIEVHVEGQPAGQFEVPVRHTPQAPDPVIVSLAQYKGRQITVKVIQTSRDDRALVEWRAITLIGRADEQADDAATGVITDDICAGFQ